MQKIHCGIELKMVKGAALVKVVMEVISEEMVFDLRLIRETTIMRTSKGVLSTAGMATKAEAMV